MCAWRTWPHDLYKIGKAIDEHGMVGSSSRIPLISKVDAILPDERKFGTERNVEAGRSDYDVDIVMLSVRVNNACLVNPSNSISHRGHIWLVSTQILVSKVSNVLSVRARSQCSKEARGWSQATTPHCEVWHEGIDEILPSIKG